MSVFRSFLLALAAALGLIALAGCGGTNNNAPKPLAQKRHLLVLVDGSPSASSPTVRRAMSKLALETIRGEAFAREGEWISLRIWGFPQGAYYADLYKSGPDLPIRTTNYEILDALDNQIEGAPVVKQATDFLPVLDKTIEYVEKATAPVTVLMLSDGGDQGFSDRQFKAIQKRAEKLGKCKQLSEFGFGPVVANSGNAGKIDRLFGALGNKLVVLKDSDIESNLGPRWLSRL